MSPITTTTTNTSVPRSSVWRSFSLHLAGLVGGKTRVTTSERKHGSSFAPTPAPSIALPAGPHRRMSAASLRPALRRASTDSATSCSSSESSSPSPAVKITFPIVSPEVDRKILLPENTKYNSAQPSVVQPAGGNTRLWLLRRPRTPSKRQRRTSRVFPDLAPPPELVEVSLTIESDDDDSEDGDAEVLPGMERKVRFLVPAPPPTIEEDYDEEPAWSEFMCIFGVFFCVNVVPHKPGSGSFGEGNLRIPSNFSFWIFGGFLAVIARSWLLTLLFPRPHRRHCGPSS
ncbi:hypothetical protein C8R44DRAFT_856287 [Mycena epipterygia]|nr:hypothetical protein C8R44DRAFT_856287 [Mycena epipterygia]